MYCDMKKTKKTVSDYKKYDILTIEQIDYADGGIGYCVKNENWSSGVHSEAEVLIEVLIAMGKITRPRVFVTPGFETRNQTTVSAPKETGITS